MVKAAAMRHPHPKTGKMLPCGHVYARPSLAYGQKHKYYGVFMYEYIGEEPPENCDWVRREGIYYKAGRVNIDTAMGQKKDTAMGQTQKESDSKESDSKRARH